MVCSARVASYDEISASTLKKIGELEKKSIANHVRGLFSKHEDGERRPPAPASCPSTPCPEKKPLRAGRRKTGDAVILSSPPLDMASSKARSRSLTSSSLCKPEDLSASYSRTMLTGADDTPKQKKPLRTGRKKVTITATGDLQPIVGPPLNSETTTSSSKSSIDMLDEIMRKLDDSEVQAAQRPIAVKENKSPHVTEIQSCGCSVM